MTPSEVRSRTYGQLLCENPRANSVPWKAPPESCHAPQAAYALPWGVVLLPLVIALTALGRCMFILLAR